MGKISSGKQLITFKGFTKAQRVANKFNFCVSHPANISLCLQCGQCKVQVLELHKANSFTFEPDSIPIPSNNS